MARPVDEDKHREVVLAAFEALRRRGVVGVTMADIASDLGMSRSALYWYVHGLSELFEQVLASVLERQAIATMSAVAEAEGPIEQVAAWMRATVRFYGDDPDLIGVLLQLWATARPGSKDETLQTFRERFEPLHAAAHELLREGIARGEVAPCDPVAIINLCAVVLDGALVHRFSRSIDSEALVDDFLARVLLPLRRDGARDRVADVDAVVIPAAIPGTDAGEIAFANRPSVPRRSAEDWMAWD
jgi:AcrR family transcriptional regulator